MKQLKDYLHLYKGVSVITLDANELADLVGIIDNDAHLIHQDTGSYGQTPIDNIKPILRPLSDLKKEERNELGEIHFDDSLQEEFYLYASITRYLLSKRFDIFGLIEANLAIDKTKVIAELI